MSAELLSLVAVCMAAVGLFLMSTVYSYRLKILGSEVKILKKKVDELEGRK
jgi:hypothetical protein